MEIEETYIDRIQRRSSRRDYQPDSLPEPVIKRIENILQNLPVTPFRQHPSFALIHKSLATKEKVKLGTYGFISGARHFIIGKTEPIPQNFVDYGFALEWIILQLTGMHLGSCWLGGTFNRSEFAKFLQISNTEVIPAITPVGYPRKKRTLRDRLIRLGAGSKRRKAWRTLFFQEDFNHPLEKEKAGDYATTLEMVRLAPSASNRQPWRIVHSDSAFHFYLQRTPGYGKRWPPIDMQLIDMGIALCHFEFTAREVQLTGQWRSADPGLRLPDGVEYILSWS